MWPFSRPKKKETNVVSAPGVDKLVQMITDQCCGWFEIPLQTPPEVLIYDNVKKPAAIYDYRTGIISVYGEENATTAILAHEVAHAVVCRYGKLSPRMHEILAGYAEFKIRKAVDV